MAGGNAAHLLERALGHHQSGKLDLAIAGYQQVLAADPTNADALNLLGVIALAAGQPDLAIDLANRAVTAAPDFAPARVNLGNALQQAGRLQEAIAAFQGAIAVEPNLPAAHANLASALLAVEDDGAALAAADAALALDPKNTTAWINRGRALEQAGQLNDAVAAYQSATKITPNDARAQFNLGTALLALGDGKAGVVALRLATRLDPNDANAAFNLGNALLDQNAFDDAAKAFGRVLAIDASHGDAPANLAWAYQAAGRFDDALSVLDAAITQSPDAADLHWNRALVYLQMGDFERGWPATEWRWKNPDFTTPVRDFGCPQWRGINDPIEGKTVLVSAEQGYGDAILMARFLPMIAGLGADVVVECRAGLERLFGAIDGVRNVVTYGDALAPADVFVPMMSLPAAFNITRDTVPSDCPYLHASDDRPAASYDGFRVGLVWAGSKTHGRNRDRSIMVQHLAALSAIEGARFVCLQKDATALDLDYLQSVVALENPMPGVTDFQDTADIIDGLDAVVSVDTAVAHLAGAMGKPVFMLSANPRNFLWLWGLADTPWYPSMQVFEQPRPGDWASAVGAVVAALRTQMS